MATGSEQFFDCLCRTCMHELSESASFNTTPTPDQEWQYIFDPIEECGALQIAQLLTNLIPQIMEAQLSDKLPKKICSGCLQQLLSVYRFQQMCTQSDQQMRALIAKRSKDPMVNLEASVKDEINTNMVLKQESLLEANQPTIEFESVSTSQETPQILAVDPLQNIEVVERCPDTENGTSKYLKNEPCNNESNVEYSDGESVSLTAYVKNKMLIKQSKQEQVRLVSRRPQHHEKTVKKLPRNVCDICRGTFSTSGSLNRHKRRYHSTLKPKKKLKKLPCNLCDEKFNTRPKLEEHQQLMHSSDALHTTVCSEDNIHFVVERDEEQEGLAQTQDSHKEILDKKISLETEEEELAGGQTSQSSYQEKIDKNVITNTEMEHDIIASGQTRSLDNVNSPRNVCSICENKFSTKSSLLRHIRRYHSTEKPKRALKKPSDNLRNEKCTTQSKVVKYKKKLREKAIKQYSCNLCDKTYKNSEALKIHIRKHTGERPYLCPECGKSFSDPSNLKQHILRHGGNKLFECPYCPLKFRCPNYVAQHKMIHEGIRRHICDICGAGFTKTCQLAVHKRYHNNDKPFKCEYCEMRFVRKSAQRVHMRTHTGEKPYECKYCDRAFAQSGDHIKHLRTHLGDNVYRCELCPLTFRLASELRSHFVTHKHDGPVMPELKAKSLIKFDESSNVSQEQVESKITE